MTTPDRPRHARCRGPLVWFDVEPRPDRGEEPGAILECNTCGYIVTTGNLLDEQHAHTALIRSTA